MRGVDLQEANLKGTNLRNADLSGANFTGADLSTADVSRTTKLEGAIFCNTLTPWGHDDSGC